MKWLLSAVVAICWVASSPALEWQPGQGFRRAALSVPQGAKAGFTSMAGATGIHFTNTLPVDRYKTNQILLNGSGVAAGDVDGDGWCDLYLCRLEGDNVLYRNLGGWRFEDMTARAGVGCPNTDASGALLADLDGDRDLDLVVNSVGNGTRIFFNDGKGKFTPHRAVLNPGRGGTSVAAGDLDGDDFLDLYIANYRMSALMDMPNTRFNFKRIDGVPVVATVNGRPATDPEFADRYVINARGGIDELGEPDLLLRNVGGTNFVPWSFAEGGFLDEEGQPLTRAPLAWGLSVAIRDINQDDRPDIYVCNDFDSPDEIWINQGIGRFRLIDRLAVRKSSLFSMGIDFADINRDGHDDFFVLDMLARERVHRLTTAGDRNPTIPKPGVFDDRPGYMMNTLFLNRGDGSYAEIAHLAGVAASDWSWAAAFIDVDLDGWEDVLISNGHERAARHMDIIDELGRRRAQRQMTPAEILEQRKLFPRLATPNIAFRNRRDLTFEKADWGFDLVGVSHGIALADLDNDGDQDVVVNNLNDPVSVYRNDATLPRVAVRLRGNAPNTHAIGARITVHGGPITQSQEIMAGGKYLSSDEPARVFAAGTAAALTVRVAWPGGKQTVISNALPNSIYEIIEENSAPAAPSSPPSVAALFEDVSHLLQHTHVETAFDDFARQPLLPYKLSQPGPAVAWVDVNNDSFPDLIISSGRGGTLSALRNDSGRTFAPITSPPLNQATERDQPALLPWHPSSSELTLLVAVSNYEDGLVTNGVRAYHLQSGRVDNHFPSLESTSGALAAADVDGDGDPDLFVGGRCLPGKYPRAAGSLLLLNNGKRFELDATNSQTLARIGMVTAAAFADLDRDRDPDLILACDWGPPRIFKNEGGVFAAWNPAVSVDSQSSILNQLTGWWTSLAVADLDGDGRQDFVAGNWGRNTQYQNYRAKPLEILQDDLDHDGTPDCLVTYFDEQLAKRVSFRGLDYLGKPLPFLRERFTTHEAFAKAAMQEMISSANALPAAWLDSTVFLNRGDRFEAVPLPVEAQMAPAFGVCTADFDGDGAEDIFLAQNFFAVHPETPRLDAGLGLVLRGDGKGHFKALSANESGVRVYGEQRGCAAGDFDKDGRMDLVVTQNGAATKLFRNKGKKTSRP